MKLSPDAFGCEGTRDRPFERCARGRSNRRGTQDAQLSHDVPPPRTHARISNCRLQTMGFSVGRTSRRRFEPEPRCGRVSGDRETSAFAIVASAIRPPPSTARTSGATLAGSLRTRSVARWKSPTKRSATSARLLFRAPEAATTTPGIFGHMSGELTMHLVRGSQTRCDGLSQAGYEGPCRQIEIRDRVGKLHDLR